MLFVVVPLLLFLVFMGVWLPNERLTVATKTIESAYVLSQDDRWTTYMDGAHKVHVARTDEVTGRDPVRSSEWSLMETPYVLWQQWQGSRHANQPTQHLTRAVVRSRSRPNPRARWGSL